MVLIKLPEHIPEIQENSLLQKYTVILGNNYDGGAEKNDNGDTTDIVKCLRSRQFNKIKKIEKRLNIRNLECRSDIPNTGAEIIKITLH
jgi:hypothetical protein